jgi:hypothetical protein
MEQKGVAAARQPEQQLNDSEQPQRPLGFKHVLSHVAAA